MTYFSDGSGPVSVDDLRSQADTIRGSATATFASGEDGTFFWKLDNPRIGQKLAALSDVSLEVFDDGTIIQNVTATAGVHIYQVAVDNQTGDAQLVSIDGDFFAGLDNVLGNRFPGALNNSSYEYTVVGPGHSSSENNEFTTWLDEFYVSVSGAKDPGVDIAAQFGMSLPDAGRFLLTTGGITGERDKAWGNWLDAQHQIDYPDGIDQQDVDRSVQPLADADSLHVHPGLEKEKPFEPVRTLSKHTLLEAAGAYAEGLHQLGELAERKFALPADPHIRIQVWSGAGRIGSVREIAKEVGHVVGFINAALTSYDHFQKTQDWASAWGAGGAKFLVSYASGEVGTIVASGVAYGIGGLVVGPVGLPALAGAAIVLGSGAVATIAMETVLNKLGSGAFPDWWPGEHAEERIVAQSAGTSSSPAWIFDADTGKMLLSLDDTHPKAWQNAATRLGVEKLVHVDPARFVQHGTAKSDLLAGAAGRDFIQGGAGDDYLYGNKGKDALVGGRGADHLFAGHDHAADVFVFKAVSDSGAHARRADRIYDFDPHSRGDHAWDRIDLRGIDADNELKGDQSFRFVEKFSHVGSGKVEGQVRTVHDSNHVTVLIDANGDNKADMSILVMDVTHLSAHDFIL